MTTKRFWVGIAMVYAIAIYAGINFYQKNARIEYQVRHYVPNREVVVYDNVHWVQSINGTTTFRDKQGRKYSLTGDIQTQEIR